jgi:hypothetical protein
MAGDAFKLLGLNPGANIQQVKQAYKDLSMKHHPDRVQPAQRMAAAARFKELSQAYRTVLSRAGAPSAGVRVENSTYIRATGGRGRFVWLTPATLPLIAAFSLLAGMTYHHVSIAMEQNRKSHRPHGLLGPTVNDFLHDQDDLVQSDDGKAERVRSVYRGRLHMPYVHVFQTAQTKRPDTDEER